MKFDKCLSINHVKVELGHYPKVFGHITNLKLFNKIQIFRFLWVLIEPPKSSKLRKTYQKIDQTLT